MVSVKRAVRRQPKCSDVKVNKKAILIQMQAMENLKAKPIKSALKNTKDKKIKKDRNRTLRVTIPESVKITDHPTYAKSTYNRCDSNRDFALTTF